MKTRCFVVLHALLALEQATNGFQPLKPALLVRSRRRGNISSLKAQRGSLQNRDETLQGTALDDDIFELEQMTRDSPHDSSAQLKLGNLLYLVRHASPAYRARAEDAFYSAMLLQPERLRVDCTLCGGPGVNNVFSSFRHGINTKAELAVAYKDAQSLRALFNRAGFTAENVRHFFGLSKAPSFGVGVMMAKRVAGRLDLDTSALPASPPSGGLLDCLVQLLVLGLAVDHDATLELLGPEAVNTMRRLGMLEDCPPIYSESNGDSELGGKVMSHVAVTPLDVPVALAHAAKIGDSEAALVRTTRPVWIATDWAPPVPIALEEEVCVWQFDL